MAFLPLDGPSSQTRVNVTTSTVVRLRVGPSELAERKVITVQPTTGNIYIYFGDGTATPNSTTVQNNGFIHYKNAIHSYEASDRQDVYMLAVSGTVSVTYAERA